MPLAYSAKVHLYLPAKLSVEWKVNQLRGERQAESTLCHFLSTTTPHPRQHEKVVSQKKMNFEQIFWQKYPFCQV